NRRVRHKPRSASDGRTTGGHARSAAMTVTLGDLNRMDLAAFEAAVGEAFELAPWVATAAHARRPFATVSDLHAAMMGAVRAAPRDTQLGFLRNHPDLAGKAAIAGDVTDDSRSEQASAGLDT